LEGVWVEGGGGSRLEGEPAPLNHDRSSDSDMLWIQSLHRNVGSVAVLVVPPRGAELRQKVATASVVGPYAEANQPRMGR